MLAPSSAQKLLSYLTAYSMLFVWYSGLACSIQNCANETQYLIAIINESYQPKRWHTVLFMWAFVLVSFLISASSRKIITWFIGITYLVHIFTSLAILIIFCAFSTFDKPSLSLHWTDDLHPATQGMSFIMSLIVPTEILSGADGMVHVSRVAAENLVFLDTSSILDG